MAKCVPSISEAEFFALLDVSRRVAIAWEIKKKLITIGLIADGLGGLRLTTAGSWMLGTS